MRLMSLSLLVLAALSASAQEGEKTTIEWKLKKGDQHRYEAGQVMEINIGGTEITAEMLFGLALEVTDVSADGVAKVKLTYDRIKTAFAGPYTSDYDSDKGGKPEEMDVIGRILAGFLNKSFTLDMNKKGECLKTEGLTKIIDAAIKELPEELPMLAQFSENTRKQFSDDNMKGAFQVLLGFLPKNPVAPGESWSTKHSMTDAIGKVSFDGNTTLKELRAEGKEAVIKTDTKVTVTPSEEGGVFGALEIEESKMKSEVVFRVAEGLLESSQSTFTLDGTAGGMDFSIVQKLKMKLAPKKK